MTPSEKPVNPFFTPLSLALGKDTVIPRRQSSYSDHPPVTQSRIGRTARRKSSEARTIRPFDFCNAFWGSEDGGVNVLLARMRGAAKSLEELRAFWKERRAPLE